MRVTAGDNEREEWEFHGGFAALARFHQDGVNVAFEVVDGDQRLVEAEAEGLGVGDADQQRACQARAFGDGDGVEVGEGDWMAGRSAGAGHSFANDGNDVAEMFAGGELGHDAAVVGVERHLRGYDVRERGGAGTNNSGGSLVAGAFDAENQACCLSTAGAFAHLSIIESGMKNQYIDNPKYRAAREIVVALRDTGHQAYFAGGCVRDLLLGVPPKDFDVATSATPDVVMGMFAKTYAVGAHFGVVLVCTPDGGGEIATEVATFRHDGAYSDGRRPDAVRFSTDAREDILRRDFTINGMLLDPAVFEETGDATAATLDYVNGREDLATGILRAIGEPALRFAEDKLRMLRGVRFAARLGLEIEPRTMAAIRAAAPEIGQVSCERIRDELTLMLTEGHARRAFELLDATGLLAYVLPEALRMKGVEQPPQFHPEGDVWVHTMLLLEKLQAGVSATLAWGALLHDIGKPATFRPPDPKKPGDRIRFDGHVEVGVRMTQEILGRLRFSNEDTEQIVALVKNHMRFGDIMQMRESTLKRFLRLPKFDEHLALHWMDASSAHGDLRLYEFAKERYEATPVETMRPKLLVTGKDLIDAGYRPGPEFKAMLEAAEDAQLEGSVTTTDDGLAMVRQRFGAPSA
jgi:poly(A) polymerase